MSSRASSPHHLLPRLYIEGGFDSHETFVLPEDQSHYLRHVLRLGEGAFVRVFHPDCGEYTASMAFEGKKLCRLTLGEHLYPAFSFGREVHLFFPPLRKERLDFLIEKAVELGVTHLHPVLFSRNVVRDIKVERLKAQIVEAAEQCERLDIPFLCSFSDLKGCFSGWGENNPVFAAVEREELPHLGGLLAQKPPVSGFLIGPEGGLTPDEVSLLRKRSFLVPVSLGEKILRAETAALYGLVLLG